MTERRRYSQPEIALLIELYPNLDAIRKRLRHRSRGAIIHKAGELGLTRKTSKWTPQEDELLRQHYPNYATAALALPQRSYHALISRAAYLGISHVKRNWRAEARDDCVVLVKDTPRGEVVAAVGRPLAKESKGSQISPDGPAAIVEVVEDIRRNCNARGIVLNRLLRALNVDRLGPNTPQRKLSWPKVAQVVEALGGEFYAEWDD